MHTVRPSAVSKAVLRCTGCLFGGSRCGCAGQGGHTELCLVPGSICNECTHVLQRAAGGGMVGNSWCVWHSALTHLVLHCSVEYNIEQSQDIVVSCLLQSTLHPAVNVLSIQFPSIAPLVSSASVHHQQHGGGTQSSGQRPCAPRNHCSRRSTCQRNHRLLFRKGCPGPRLPSHRARSTCQLCCTHTLHHCTARGIQRQGLFIP